METIARKTANGKDKQESSIIRYLYAEFEALYISNIIFSDFFSGFYRSCCTRTQT